MHRVEFEVLGNGPILSIAAERIDATRCPTSHLLLFCIKLHSILQVSEFCLRRLREVPGKPVTSTVFQHIHPISISKSRSPSHWILIKVFYLSAAFGDRCSRKIAKANSEMDIGTVLVSSGLLLLLGSSVLLQYISYNPPVIKNCFKTAYQNLILTLSICIVLAVNIVTFVGAAVSSLYTARNSIFDELRKLQEARHPIAKELTEARMSSYMKRVSFRSDPCSRPGAPWGS
ncbi:uncharacterized protein EV422DRAFT_507159 [Fimicolochytrium jonesii]|uniref:uncharacterized protein n=1 Tax=Fimicolochytrium jonesii TaxID=1396493 RepID=UPI0022FECEB8|nr:uncharacterized protein EV422DRAFT_507159 [Fimicolochytrium jonesii]KAI8820005.1 hypothetical protein EV422DRAFT_507159 [Fimicolochytrium jonesii]